MILTENMFGDILSDEAAMLTGSLGMLPSASLGGEGPGLFEPVHGSAPDIAGTGKANPLAMFLSVAMMLRYGLGREDEAAAVESAVDRALDEGLRTTDLGGDATTDEATEASWQPRRSTHVSTSGPHLDERGVRRLGGREGARTHPRAPLRHGRLRGHPRLRDRRAAPAIFRHQDHLDRLSTSAELYYMDIPYSRGASARRRTS